MSATTARSSSPYDSDPDTDNEGGPGRKRARPVKLTSRLMKRVRRVAAATATPPVPVSSLLNPQPEPVKPQLCPLSKQEQQYLKVYIKSVNGFIPMTTRTTLSKALSTQPTEWLSGQFTQDDDEYRFHARAAVLMGAVALGAQYSGDEHQATQYMAFSHSHLRLCFDAVLPDVVSCYIIFTVYHLHHLDVAKIFKYINFAQEAWQELSPAAQAANGDLWGCIHFLSILCHVACDHQIKISHLDIENDPLLGRSAPPARRLLAVIAYVFINNYRRLTPSARQRAHVSLEDLPSPSTISKYVAEANSLVQQFGRANDLGALVITAMQGYFDMCLQKGDTEAVKAAASVVATTMMLNPAVLYFPLTWHMCRSANAYLKRSGTPQSAAIAADMDTLMQPLYQKLKYSTICCGVVSDIIARYDGSHVLSSAHTMCPGPSPAEEAQGMGLEDCDVGTGRRGAQL